MKSFLKLIVGGLSALSYFLGALGIEIGFVVSIVLTVLKLCGICAVGWGIVVAFTLVPLGLLILSIILMGIITLIKS